MNGGRYSKAEKSDWQKLQRVLTFQLRARVWMKSKSRLIESTINLEILIDEIKRMVSTKKMISFGEN